MTKLLSVVIAAMFAAVSLSAFAIAADTPKADDQKMEKKAKTEKKAKAKKSMSKDKMDKMDKIDKMDKNDAAKK